MRVVLDTNVVLSGLLWRGPPFRVLEAIRESDRTELFTSPMLLEELAEVLLRPELAKRLIAIGRSARELLETFVEAAEIVVPTGALRVVPNHIDDDHVIAAAVAAKAGFIISGIAIF